MNELSMLIAFLTAALAGNAVGNAMYDQLKPTGCMINSIQLDVWSIEPFGRSIANQVKESIFLKDEKLQEKIDEKKTVN